MVFFINEAIFSRAIALVKLTSPEIRQTICAYASHKLLHKYSSNEWGYILRQLLHFR